MLIFHHSEIHPGGVQNLIINLTEVLLKLQINVKIIDVESGYISKVMSKKGLGNVIILENEYFKYKFEEQVYFILFGSIGSNSKFIRKKFNIIYWQVFPFSFFNHFTINGIRIPIISSIISNHYINIFIKYRSFYVMGENHNKYLKLHNIVIDYDNILPVPINVPIINYYKAKNREKIIICYIGRPEIWKINPIIKVLNDLKKTTLYTQVNIISNDTDEYKRYIDDKFDVKFISGIYGDKLTAYLIENVDIQIGMGTTLLESGKLGIPTIVVDASYTKMADNYKYKWLFRNKSHDLGEEILFNLSTSEGEDLKDLIEMYLNDSKSISNKTYNYVKNEHDRTLITNKLLKSLSDSSLKAKEVWLLITFLKIKNKISNKLFGNANKPT